MSLDDRTRLLINQNNLDKLNKIKVLVVGLGGVGSIVPISLVRSGVKNITIIDKDKVEDSNLNRQIAYNFNDIGTLKSVALKKHLLEIRSDINVTEIHDDIKNISSLNDKFDYVVDCIDDIKGKIHLIEYAFKNNIKIISSLGMGNRFDPTKVKITKLNKTTIDPLARKLRYELKKRNVDISLINVSFSEESPIIKDRVISSMIFTPNASGLALASYIIKDVIKEENK